MKLIKPPRGPERSGPYFSKPWRVYPKKCIKHILTNEIVRVTDAKAEEMIASNSHVYVPKSEWKKLTKFTKPVCSTCGSDDIVVDAYARWNPVTQQFELDGDTSTTSLCGKCGGETSIRNIPLAGGQRNMKHVLIEIKNLIQDPSNWTQGTHARNKKGFAVEPTDPDASQWCLDGALAKVTNVDNDLLRASTRELYALSNFVEVNDEGSHHQVLAILDHAIGLPNAKAA